MSIPEKRDPGPETWDKASRQGSGLEFSGEIHGKDDFLIRGRVQGKVRLPENDVLVDEGGRVEADLVVRNIVVKGEVIGNIAASGRVVIERTGRLTGDLAASVISIEDGAQFKGSIKILGKA
jgi:cytoskeletal protein CcmA (bactofilin family)